MWSSRQFNLRSKVEQFLNINKETITNVSICNNGGNITNNAFVVFFKIREGCIVYEVNN
jgi:hypothetical protein